MRDVNKPPAWVHYDWQANSDAALGKYATSAEHGMAGDQSLYIANHQY